MKLLVACHELRPSGGMLRCERIARALTVRHHEVAYLALLDEPRILFPTSQRVLDMTAARAETWDATLVPGAGFTPDIRSRFPEFSDRNFGKRVQLVLSDQAKRDKFLEVNAAFNPDLIIFNNDDWSAASIKGFSGTRFHTLVGAVDTTMFQPPPQSTKPSGDGRFVVGAQISKHPEPVIQALRLLPDNFSVRFFGVDRKAFTTRIGPELASGRAEYVGPLFDADLAAYYHSVDAVVSTETSAGWANIVAEAMASGTPAVTTRAGTGAIAIDGETALVLDVLTPELLAQALLRLRNEPGLAATITDRARRRIEAFDWRAYSDRLVDLIASDDVPSDGIFLS